VAKQISDTEQQFYARIGARIERARRQRGMTQAQLAEHISTSYGQLQKYECGTNRIPVFALARIADAMDVPMDELLPFYEILNSNDA
jgi:transcriptional regulator with XRE-family HTH domain